MSDAHTLYTEAWWIKALDGELTPVEAQQWEVHLAQCGACRREWDALQLAEHWLLVAPAAPALPDSFTAQTTARIEHALRLRRIWAMVAPTLIVGLVTWLVVGYLGLALSTVEWLINALVLGWQPLLLSLVRALVSVLWTWRIHWPLIIAGITCGVLFLMPNSVMATAALVWLARHRPSTSAA